MWAITQDRYGDVDVLEFRDIDQPVPMDNEVLVQVHAAGLHRGDWPVMTGLPYLIRIVVPTLGLRRPKVAVLGMDVAGTLKAVGQKASRFQPGDEVFGWTDGSFAEYAVTPEDQLAAKPANLSFEQVRSSPSPASPPAKGFATWARSSRASRSWSSGRPAALGRSGCSYLRPSQDLPPAAWLVLPGGRRGRHADDTTEPEQQGDDEIGPYFISRRGK